MMNNVEWLSKLIQFDTTSRHSNLELIHYLQEWLQAQGVTCRVTQSPSEPKANLLATLPGKNGDKKGGIILSGHTDVVPVDGQQWQTSPFDAVIQDNKVYGRGASDMKGFLAVVLALVPEWQTQQLEAPIHLAFSYDEEVGCHGAPILINDLLAAGIRPRACIVGEPTMMQPVIGHKGIQVYRCRVHGRAAHSSLVTQGCNAIEYAAQLICYLRQLADTLKKQEPLEHAYEVPFTSMTTNMIHGGNAVNTIPEFCEFTYEFRHMASLQPTQLHQKIEDYIQQELLPRMRQEYPEASVELNRLAAVPAFELIDHEQAIANVKHLLGQSIKDEKVAYATEAGIFQAANIPTIVCGPGSIHQAHRANEFIAIEQLNLCTEFLRRVVM